MVTAKQLLMGAAFLLFITDAVNADPPLKVFPKIVMLKVPVTSGKGQGATPKQAKTVTLKRNGYGLCEWGFFQVDLYWAALYLEKTETDPEKILKSSGAKRVHLHLVRTLTKSQLQRAYSASFKINAGKDLPRYKKRVDQLTAMLEECEEGDDLIFTYVPDVGLKVKIKNKARGTIKGEDFGRMFFRLYIGDNPPDENLKKGMLDPTK